MAETSEPTWLRDSADFRKLWSYTKVSRGALIRSSSMETFSLGSNASCCSFKSLDFGGQKGDPLLQPLNRLCLLLSKLFDFFGEAPSGA